VSVETETGPFAVVPLWMVTALTEKNAGGTGSALRVWVALHQWVNYNSRHAIPSKQTIAESVGASINTVERALNLLRDVGALTWEQRRDEAGDLTSNDYLLHYANPSMQEGSTTDGATGSTTNGVVTRPISNEKKKSSTSSTRRASSTPWPEGWSLDGDLLAWTRRECPHVNITNEWQLFHDWAISKDARYVKWEATWRNWARRAETNHKARPRLRSQPVDIRYPV